MNKEHKTKEEALKYFKKLQKTIGEEYKLNYYEIDTDDDLKDMTFTSNNDVEKIIRLISLKNDNRYKNQNLKLGIITIDLTNILDKNGNQFYKVFFEKAKEVFENELCDI